MVTSGLVGNRSKQVQFPATRVNTGVRYICGRKQIETGVAVTFIVTDNSAAVSANQIAGSGAV